MPNAVKFAKFANYSPKNPVDNLVDFEKCCKTRIFLQRSAPIQPKTSEILPKICQKLIAPQAMSRSQAALPASTPPPWDAGRASTEAVTMEETYVGSNAFLTVG